MHVLHIQSDKEVEQLKRLMQQPDTHLFILVFMEGCGPCNATRPEWAKLESALKHNKQGADHLVIADVNKDLLPKLSFLQLGSIDGFPTLKHVHGGVIKAYEDSGVRTKNRSIDSFVQWIEEGTGSAVSQNGGRRSRARVSTAYDVYARLLPTQRRRKHKRKTNKRRYKKTMRRRR